MTTADILEAAAAEIERVGLRKGGYWDLFRDDGPCCAIGAIRRVLGKAGPSDDSHRLAARVARHLNVGSLHCWNDAPERTAADVIAALRAAAAAVREGSK